MLLLTVREWIGLSRDARRDREPIIQLQGFVTRLTLGEAIGHLRAYEDAYKRKYSEVAVEFNVVAVANIDDLTQEQIGAGRMELIENMRLDDESGEGGQSGSEDK